MEFGSISLLVKDADAALKTYLKLFGTNNVQQVVKIKGLKDTIDVVDGYYLKTQPINLEIYQPRHPMSRMAEFLQRNGEGIHHITLHLGQDEFEQTYTRFKNQGMPVSETAVYQGKFSEAVFWLKEDGEQGVPVKFAAKCYHGLKIWNETTYLDTPQKFEIVTPSEEYLMPKITLGTIMITVKDWKKQPQIWANLLSQPALDIGNLSTLEEGEVDDGRGNIFLPVKYRFPGGGAINLYCALNQDAPINKVMASRGRTVMYHNICSYVVRDKVQEYWSLLDEAGFAMVDPKPMLNKDKGNGNYFYFVHPASTHGVLCEIVSAYTMDKDNKLFYDWSDTETYMVPPEINKSNT
jgi:hypothetical protein